MSLRRVQVSDFRCLRSAVVEIDPTFTLLSGPNAAGKTSLLESLYVLGRGRSFRTRRLEHLIRAGAEKFVVFGEVNRGDHAIRIGVEGSGQGMRAQMGGDRVASLGELAAAFPVQIIDPEVHRLIDEGPSRRRQFLDWGVFHVEHPFIGNWQRYNQVLRQRNAALKARHAPALVMAWDGELIRLGVSIHEARAAYLARLEPLARVTTMNLLGMELSLSYRTGWLRDSTLADALKGSWTQDYESGATQVGPQRADLQFRLDGAPVKDRISRGQQKLLAAALLMSQLSLFPRDTSTRPTLLLDDPAAELDTDRLLGLIHEVTERAIQLIVTSLSPTFTAFGTPGRHYRLASGTIQVG